MSSLELLKKKGAFRIVRKKGGSIELQVRTEVYEALEMEAKALGLSVEELIETATLRGCGGWKRKG